MVIFVIIMNNFSIKIIESFTPWFVYRLVVVRVTIIIYGNYFILLLLIINDE